MPVDFARRTSGLTEPSNPVYQKPFLLVFFDDNVAIAINTM
jgi:uncharacterized protein YqkB